MKCLSTTFAAALVIAASAAPAAVIIEDFDGNGLGGTWTSATRSTTAVSTGTGQSGTNSLLWTYNDNGSTQWSNEIKLTFATAQDWTGATKFTYDLKLGTNTATKKVLGFYVMNGTQKLDYTPVYWYSSATTTAFTTMSITIPTNKPVDKVTAIAFYLDGSMYNNGDNQFFIDNITVDAPAAPAAPEPASLLTVGAGGLLILLGRRGAPKA